MKNFFILLRNVSSSFCVQKGNVYFFILSKNADNYFDEFKKLIDSIVSNNIIQIK